MGTRRPQYPGPGFRATLCWGLFLLLPRHPPTHGGTRLPALPGHRPGLTGASPALAGRFDEILVKNLKGPDGSKTGSRHLGRKVEGGLWPSQPSKFCGFLPGARQAAASVRAPGALLGRRLRLCGRNQAGWGWGAGGVGLLPGPHLQPGCGPICTWTSNTPPPARTGRWPPHPAG